ncbi:Ppx/GppA phosphatase family protein [Allonocardiopsis opalescens]|uniref:Exopolyphosphatase/guanosine-5'-triphosphate, 3'-diphosphate pyrophosphatase n=1 Tax=Allonocardiopsis opalescens TaxID=1144618 RepID=A0A2T0QDD6_9ACTN|nr:Ppx/GppA phosphatase family protein [Allonocardiopsis opalescens]PRY01863.1 exopolyphosphatase/guanosine-5'-triphosphate,3'-diphosphate pyrophosphatase [Allonocardiopsis opalescens]
MTRVAAIDCGTNSIRLLIAEPDPATGGLRDIERRMEIVRLGQGVDETGRLAPEALQRTFTALTGFVKLIDQHAVGSVRMVATSATRDAANRQEFIDGVRGVLGVEPEVITGDAEARLSFAGATAELAGRELPEPYLVVDIGGGSTEFVLGGTEVAAAASVDIGCVRLTERRLRSDPPTPPQVAAATGDIEAAVERASGTVPLRSARTLVGLAGTVTTVAGIALGLSGYDAERIHHSSIPARQVYEVSTYLLALPREQRARIPVMHPGRIDVIAAGALILDRVMRRLDVSEVLVSEHDILDGIAWSLLGRRV